MGGLLEYLANPSLWALGVHRHAHRLWARNRRRSAFILAAWARVLTGIDIHPAAAIGRNVRIGHGVGLVIGATAEVGDGCELLQGVTLGRRRGVILADGRRHPKLGRRVEVGANAVLLGPITVGDDAKIGAGAIVLQDVPSGWTAVGNPARLLPPKAERAAEAHRLPRGEGLEGPALAEREHRPTGGSR
jgi:serine O-acetyltransferase